jgi:nucleoside-diphosphate-sugar epimerase
MMHYVVGARGLTGSAVCRALEARGLPFERVQREDAERVAGTNCDMLWWCAGNAVKWRANEDPAWDLEQSVVSVSGYLHTVRAERWVMMSTVDVYPEPDELAGTSEDAPVDRSRLSPYGLHKRMAEDLVARFAPASLRLRLPGLVGPGLAKNPVFDHLTPDREVRISRRSSLNFVYTDWVAEAALELAEAGVTGALNLAAREPLAIGELAELTGVESASTPDAEEHVQRYAIDVSRAARHLALPTSAEAVLRHAAGLAAGV